MKSYKNLLTFLMEQGMPQIWMHHAHQVIEMPDREWLVLIAREQHWTLHLVTLEGRKILMSASYELCYNRMIDYAVKY